MRRGWRRSKVRPSFGGASAMCTGILFACAILADIEPVAAESTGTRQTGSACSPYFAGTLIGLFSMFTFYFSNRPAAGCVA